MKMRASHILFSYAGAKNSTHSRGIAFAMQDAERVQKDIEEGKYSFQVAAKENSACPSGKRAGGDLGWFEEEEMVIEFTTACKTTPVGQLGGHPIVSPFGVHIIYRTG